jgi:hypothetical protein
MRLDVQHHLLVILTCAVEPGEGREHSLGINGLSRDLQGMRGGCALGRNRRIGAAWVEASYSKYKAVTRVTCRATLTDSVPAYRMGCDRKGGQSRDCRNDIGDSAGAG